MKAIIKDKNSIPNTLIDETRTNTFDALKTIEAYPPKNNDYKTTEVFEVLKSIYNCKCAFCEGELLNSPKHIEHYRPKNKNAEIKKCNADTSYFWLAFSWDNLLLACTSCNSSKGNCFDIQGNRIEYTKYKDYTLDQVQSLIKELDSTEKPLLVNPEQEEQDFFDKYLIFTPKGKILSKNIRLRYTIRVCKLNRDELVKLRLKLINTYRNKIRRRKSDYSLGIVDINEYARNIALLHKDLHDELMNEPKFSALHYFGNKYFNAFVKEINM